MKVTRAAPWAQAVVSIEGGAAECQQCSSASYKSDSSGFEEAKRWIVKLTKKQKTSDSFDTFNTEDNSDLKEKILRKETRGGGYSAWSTVAAMRRMNRRANWRKEYHKTRIGWHRQIMTEEIIKAESRCEEPYDEDTDLDDDGWSTLLDVKSKKKADVIVNKIGKESDDEYQEELTEDKSEGIFLLRDITQEKIVLRNIAYRISLIEETAIRWGAKLSGPLLNSPRRIWMSMRGMWNYCVQEPCY